MQNYILFEEYITLGKLLKEISLISTGGQAKIFLAENEGRIFYNGLPENRRGKKLRAGDVVDFPDYNISVEFSQASEAEIAERNEEMAEEARVKAIVKKMNAENKAATKTNKTPAKRGKNSTAKRAAGAAAAVAQTSGPRFPGRK